MEPAFMTIPEAAQYLRVARSSFYDRFVTQGRVPVVRIGRSVRIPTRAVQDLAAELLSDATDVVAAASVAGQSAVAVDGSTLRQY
jgi:excisionase family DNA binding protein